MGITYELNWYLVINDKNNINLGKDDTFFVVKDGQRIYPVNSEIPLIIKNIGCIGIVNILGFSVKHQETTINFKYIQNLDPEDVIAKHYFGMYLYMKNK